MLAAYDLAAWHSTDAVQALNPSAGSVVCYVGQLTGSGWVVVWGRFTERGDRFLIAYEAIQGASPQDFKVKAYDPPKEGSAFQLFAAKALMLALKDFGGRNRPYNAAVLPGGEGDQFYVYIYPAQTKVGLYPLGGDVRYVISPDGSAIVDKRQLHKTILDRETAENSVAGFHTHVLDEVPQDTDVFHVLSRRPSSPEYIATRKYAYLIQPDGTIKYLGEAEKLFGKK